MAQNPIRARMCGFGEKDRRPMDPPPIVKLIVRNEDGSLANVSQYDVSFYMVVADIYSADGSTPCTLVTNPATIPQSMSSSAVQTMGESTLSVLSLDSPNTSASRNLTGSTVASGNLLTDLDGQLGVFFVFQDMSVRSDGVFTLKFSFALPPTQGGPPSQVTATCFSEPFTIYSAKRFPGMTESTALSKHFAKQGIKVPIRKEARVRKIKKSAVDDGSGGKSGAAGARGPATSSSSTIAIAPAVSSGSQVSGGSHGDNGNAEYGDDGDSDDEDDYDDEEDPDGQG
ncbi:hypothetical protein BGW42_005780 [Actinomortierella wolfii]|nr:hypothetical protein BGW42_005780 [Actinomortierella wolfii]